jgi:hypothetical protein
LIFDWEVAICKFTCREENSVLCGVCYHVCCEFVCEYTVCCSPNMTNLRRPKFRLQWTSVRCDDA